MSDKSSLKQKVTSQLPIIITSLICVILIFIANYFTKEKIIKNKQRAAMAIVNQVLPVEFNNDLFTDNFRIDVPESINPTGKINLYIAKQDNQVVAISLSPVITKGYGGNMHLLVGISVDGSLLGVHILEHNETNGFGDQAHQDKSDWLTQFNGYKFDDIKEDKWEVKKDGGVFDQVSGATITSRSIIRIIYQVLQFYSENRDTLIK